MAKVEKRLSTNVRGDFYVDSTCINCDTCRQLAPKSFEEVGDYSAVLHQPEGDLQVHQAYQALLACPVGSIGTEHNDKEKLQAARDSFPMHLEGGVYYCGFNSEKSFGANSFFIEHPDGNWLVDSPRYLKQLVEFFWKKGGLRYIFLSHEDDVADCDRYARQFGATRMIHRADSEAVPGAERIIEGEEPIRLAPQFQALPVPGHTSGSMALLYDDQFLFTGDHLWWNPDTKTLGSPQNLVWRERVLVASIEKLLAYRFEWVLAGHGDRVKLPVQDMHAKLTGLLERRRAAAGAGAPAAVK
jgi:glyoxylase-like metal-dependent hydrolase (beta-lactamase superfamily II)/ferredoxin